MNVALTMAGEFGAGPILATGGPIEGKAAFIGVFILLLVWLLVMPRRLIGETETRLPWWRNTRVWAVLIVLVEIMVYYRWG